MIFALGDQPAACTAKLDKYEIRCAPFISGRMYAFYLPRRRCRCSKRCNKHHVREFYDRETDVTIVGMFIGAKARLARQSTTGAWIYDRLLVADI